ncbi:hypothetical protein M1437_01830 [Patescibacteria group bacterium]|nr:hypothetical protein [Patescibacteria group bacterium]
MANFNRGNRSGGGRGFERRDFNRGSRRPVQMHQAVCDNCGQSCEVPFRPTSGKPIFCSNCFEKNRNSDSRPSNFEEKRMFDAVCDECGNNCKVPFQPSGEKPVYCSNCFGDKKEGGNRNREQFQPRLQPQPQYNEQFEVLNNKLDRILAMLIPNAVDKIEEIVNVEKITKAKRSPSKKKTLKA